jgi:hypothetical protein
MKSKDKLLSSIPFAICIAVTVLCLLSFVVSYVIGSFRQPDTSWRKETSPLDVETRINLCKILNLQTDDPLCLPNRDVYADQFFPLIERYFPNKSTTYDSINEKLGKYQIRRESISRDLEGNSYYRVWYDLRGDGVTAIVYYFSEKDNTAFRIGTRLGEGD